MFFVCKIWIHIGLKIPLRPTRKKNISYKNMFFSAWDLTFLNGNLLFVPFSMSSNLLFRCVPAIRVNPSFFRRLLWIASNYCVIEWLLIGLDDNRDTRMETSTDIDGHKKHSDDAQRKLISQKSEISGKASPRTFHFWNWMKFDIFHTLHWQTISTHVHQWFWGFFFVGSVSSVIQIETIRPWFKLNLSVRITAVDHYDVCPSR